MISRLTRVMKYNARTQLIEAEPRRAERAPLPDSMDLYFQGAAAYHKGVTPENMTQARGFYERALTLDPGNIEALVGNARVDMISISAFLTDDRAARAAAAEATLTKVLSLAPNHAVAQYVLGSLYPHQPRRGRGHQVRTCTRVGPKPGCCACRDRDRQILHRAGRGSRKPCP